MPNRRQVLGTDGEAAVAEWYRRRGYIGVATNWGCRPGGLELGVRKGRVLVFCEVKPRSSTAYGPPAEAVTTDKRNRLRRLAAHYLEESKFRAREVRFDVAAVLNG